MSAHIAFHGRTAAAATEIPREWVEASDWFVIFTLGTLFVLLSSFAVWAWILWRRSSRPAPHVRLIMDIDEEIEKQPEVTQPPTPSHSLPAWERPADWWKTPTE